MVQPVSIPAVAPSIADGAAAPWEGGERWIPAEWEAIRFDAVRADRTAVNSSGTPQAFALSLADVVHLSTETGPFPNTAQRVAARNTWWWLRSLSNTSFHAWVIHSSVSMHGQMGGGTAMVTSDIIGGVRPALIINQSN